MRLSVQVALALAFSAFVLSVLFRVTDYVSAAICPELWNTGAFNIVISMAEIFYMMAIAYCWTGEESAAAHAIDCALVTAVAAAFFMLFLVPMCITIDAAAMKFVFELTVTVAAVGLLYRCGNDINES